MLAAQGNEFNPTRTLSGFVYEIVEGREAPIEGVRVYCEACTEEIQVASYTDKNGFYSFTGVWGTNFWIAASKDGYRDPPDTADWPGYREVTINGDNTRLSIQLARK
jgi:hypothetical protein